MMEENSKENQKVPRRQEDEQTIRNDLQKAFEEGDVKRALNIKQELGAGIDFSDIISQHVQEIKKGFEEHLRGGRMNFALNIKQELGEGIKDDLDNIFEDLIQDDGAFNELLERMPEPIKDNIKDLFGFPALSDDPVEKPQIGRRHLYLARMLALYPDIYRNLIQYLKEKRINTDYFKGTQGSRLDKIIKLEEALKKIKEGEIDRTKPSFSLEIEILNKDDFLEIDTPITNDPQKICELVKLLDEFNEDLIKDIKKTLIEERKKKRRRRDGLETKEALGIVGVYDSVHINIGIPTEEAKNAIQNDIKEKKGLYRVLMLIGIIYNPLGRSGYMFNSHLNSLIELNTNAKEGYSTKLQNRLWSFTLASENYPHFKALITYLNQRIKLYGENPQEAREQTEQDATDIVQAIEENSPSYKALINNQGIPNVSRVESLTTLDQIYYPERDDVLDQTMHIIDKANTKDGHENT